MIERDLARELVRAATQLPVVTLTGPRQSGKTTLCRMTFPEKAYVNLERLDSRQLAQDDPRGFLANYPDGAIVDEVQHAPDLLSYLQADVDEDPTPGRFILTGSQQLPLNAAISQTLAGRTAILHLLPFSIGERRKTDFASDDLWEDIFRGSYPRVYDRQIEPERWYGDYLATYVERDVHQLKDIGDLRTFRDFMRLAAGRTAQEVVLSTLAGDVGITHPTVKSWLGVLEACFLILTAPGWHRSIRKQVVKSPKIHFLDTGLVCSLLGISDPDQLRTHPLRGAIFESWVAGEIVKAFFHSGRRVDLKHFRESRGLEFDIVVEKGLVMHLVECKSGATMQPVFTEALKKTRMLFGERLQDVATTLALVYGGEESFMRSEVGVYGWRDVSELAARIVGS
jgi:uncharacterized protein